MDLEALGASPAGRLVPIQGQDARHGPFAYFAYLPHPLADDVSLRSASWASVVKAETAIGRLDLACEQLPDPRLLIRPALLREALDTSALEGTVAPLQELLEAQLPSAQYLSPETIEINAYIRIALEAFDIVRDRPISTSLLAELQGELFKNAGKQPADLGRIRQEPVWIGAKDRPISEARFVPPPPDDRLQSGLDSWEAWVRGPHQDLPAVLQAALAHYQFETLHPFSDGNGRIGRLVVVLQLLRAPVLHQPALTVSPWFLRRRAEYQEHLLRVSCTGEWDPWVQFFSRAVSDQCESLIRGARSLRDWLEESRQILHDKRWTGKIHQVLQDLVEWPVITVANTATRYNTSVGNATRMIEHLVEVGILRELTGKSYGRLFGSVAVMDVVEAI